MKIDRFLEGFTALDDYPGDTPASILLPGYSIRSNGMSASRCIHAELRLTGLGSAGGGGSVIARDEGDDDEDDLDSRK